MMNKNEILLVEHMYAQGISKIHQLILKMLICLDFERRLNFHIDYYGVTSRRESIFRLKSNQMSTRVALFEENLSGTGRFPSPKHCLF